MGKIPQRGWLAWLAIGLLATTCSVLAALQYRWIGEIAGSQREQLHAELQGRLNTFSRAFNQEIATAVQSLFPSVADLDTLGREAAYAAQYTRWKETHDRMFRRLALAVPRDGSLNLLMLDLDTAQYSPAEWPAEWSDMHDRLQQRAQGGSTRGGSTRGGSVGPGPVSSSLFEFPRFRSGPPAPGPPEAEWMLAELDLDYAANTLLPLWVNRGLSDYHAKVVTSSRNPVLIYDSAPSREPSEPDATVAILDVRPFGFGGRGGRGPGSPPPQSKGAGPPPGPGVWRLMVWNKAGSLESLVARTRARNLAVSGAILLMILSSVGTLMRLSRKSQQLAEQQINFVAGVSHELRTPLTVIRTAAFNLQGKLASRPESVSRYGALIQSESEKLAALVEQVLRFASAQAGHVIHAREPVTVETLIEDGLQSSRVSLDGSPMAVEKHIEPNLPLVMADALAMRHAIQNLVENALKYGTEGSNWIGLFATAVNDSDGPAVEIRVADHGPGIPLDEQKQIFDPFFRGRRAVRDQVHGTGLGLNLVKRIVEAHGGTIRVHSEPMQGTEFVVRIPAAPPEVQNELSHSLD